MADQQINFLIKAQNTASPEFKAAAAELRNLSGAVTAYGTATPQAKRATAEMLFELRGMQGATGGAKVGLEGLGQAAKGVAAGGFQNLLSAIPGVGGALANLAGQLGTMPLLLGGLAAAGVGALKFLQSLGAEADAALAKTTKLAEGLGTQFRQTLLEVAKIRAEAAGDKTGAVEAGTKAALASIEAEKDARIKAAKAELDTLDLLGRKRTELSQEALNAIVAAEGDAANKTILVNERKRADLQKIDADRLADEKKNREEAVKAEAEAAEKQKALLKSLSAASLDIFKGLGGGFEDVVKSIELAQFVDKSTEAIDQLEKAMNLGLDSTGRFGEGVAALEAKMVEAINLGYVPTVEAANKVAETVTVAAVATEKASDSVAAGLFRMGAASADVIATLDAVIAKGIAASSAFAGAGRGGPVGSTGAGSAVRPEAGGGGGPSSGVYGGPFGGSVLGDIVNQPKGSGLTPFNPAYNPVLGPGQESGTVNRSVTPNPNPASAAGYRPQATVQTVNLTVNQTGTVISQERDWGTLVESMRQSLGGAY
jgi:hypothetical protein